MLEGQESSDDVELLAMLRSMLTGSAAVPAAVTAAARAAFDTRSLDAELAALIYDSATDDRLLVGSRAAADSARILVFRTEESTIEIEFVDGRALGQIDPAGAGTVSLESPQAALGQAEIDSAGCFVIEGSFSGMIRIVLHGPDDARLVTEWTRL
jgi:5-keto 4-deoxyuronate isomerase